MTTEHYTESTPNIELSVGIELRIRYPYRAYAKVWMCGTVALYLDDAVLIVVGQIDAIVAEDTSKLIGFHMDGVTTETPEGIAEAAMKRAVLMIRKRMSRSDP